MRCLCVNEKGFTRPLSGWFTCRLSDGLFSVKMAVGKEWKPIIIPDTDEASRVNPPLRHKNGG